MNPPSHIFPLQTPRLALHLLAPEHIPAILTYRQLPNVTRYLSKRAVTAESILEEIEWNRAVPVGTPGYRVRVVIIPHEIHTVVGDAIIKITEDEPLQGELTYVLHPDAQGKGYVSEAMQAFVAFAFDTLRLHRLTATIFADHIPSIRVAERLGMRREAHFRKAVLREGEWIDDTIYALLREEWNATRPIKE